VGDEGKAVDELLDGLAAAQVKKKFKLSEMSEQRRLNLLPQTAPMGWDELMVSHAYIQALQEIM
jgi:beta-N-acetylhexosaminidase